MSSGKEKALLAVFSIAVSTGLMWYIVADTGLGIGAATLIGLMVSCGMWGVLLCSQDEAPKRQLVIGPFLERHVLQPLEKRRWEKWREEGRAQERAEIRARMEKLGLNPDEFLPPKENDGKK